MVDGCSKSADVGAGCEDSRMDERWAIAPEDGGGATLVALHPDGQPAGEIGHEGRLGEPRSAAAAWARLSGAPVPPDPPMRAVVPGEQSSLFEIPAEPIAFEALLRVYADQLRRHDLAEHPDRMRLLTASES